MKSKNVWKFLIGDIRGSLNKFPDFFHMGTFIESSHMKLKSLWSNLLRLQCTCCTVPTTSGRPQGSLLVWVCQWLSSLPLSSPQLLITTTSKLRELPKVTGGKVWTIGRLRNCLDAHLGQIVCDNDGVVDWCIVLKSAGLFRWNLFLNSLKTST